MVAVKIAAAPETRKLSNGVSLFELNPQNLRKPRTSVSRMFLLVKNNAQLAPPPIKLGVKDRYRARTGRSLARRDFRIVKLVTGMFEALACAVVVTLD